MQSQMQNWEVKVVRAERNHASNITDHLQLGADTSKTEFLSLIQRTAIVGSER